MILPIPTDLLLSMVPPFGHIIDTECEALPPRCDIFTFGRCSHFACAHRSHYRAVTIDRLQTEALPSLAYGYFATFVGKFSHFFIPFYLILSLSFRPPSPFTRPQPAAPGSMLAILESEFGEDFLFGSQLGQKVCIVMFVFCFLH